MREGVTVEVNAADRARLEVIVVDRNSRQKVCLAGADRAADSGWAGHHAPDGSKITLFPHAIVDYHPNPYY
jgi:hypothetical protein